MHWHSGHKLECQQLSVSHQSSDSNGRHGGIAQIKAQTAASKSLWTEYEIQNEHESEYDTEMSGDEGHANNSLIPRNRDDETMKSLMDNFEGDGDKKSWASFQPGIQIAETIAAVISWSCHRPKLILRNFVVGNRFTLVAVCRARNLAGNGV
ncbi:uncharacterized protein LOC120177067 [Hibiscus syriacus]|uniref:uncharacterized protein LOC120177067 n=1 Tax=Hibiscus syriacus TaxID=106335 RepID=UPI0019204A39|nr:uncharacterized protein LOC120177067 [Hibiscus syriacus]